MEADWEVEIGGDAPVIDGAWTGSVDLRTAPERIAEVAEAIPIPGMPETLLRLNSVGSTVYTTKCDVWIPEAIDPDEMDATIADAQSALACYIDMLSSRSSWKRLSDVEAFCRTTIHRLGKIPMKCARIDLVVRQACLAEGDDTVGITAYVAACGAERDRAEDALGRAVSALADTILAAESENQTPQSTIKATGE